MSRARPLAVVGIAVLCAACAAEKPAASLPEGYRLVQKRQYQALYGPGGRLLRVLEDANRDGRADAVITYRRDGTPATGEIDTDRDGAVDRWERFALDGSVDLVGVSQKARAQPDYWEHRRADGTIWQRDWDDDGDGQPDRSDNPPPRAETVNATAVEPTQAN
jgi:hypothetical protein